MRVAAFQNGYHVALCNRVGKEERLDFAGESFVCDPRGEITARAGRGSEELLLAEVDPEAPARSHARRLFLRDRRPELYPAWLAGAPR
jgi:N-carbamoylputrescine amidase